MFDSKFNFLKEKTKTPNSFLGLNVTTNILYKNKLNIFHTRVTHIFIDI